MHKTIHQYYVYILTNKKNGTLYIGMTNDLQRRIYEHKNKLNDAIKREKNLKKWKRDWKINLIIKDNPQWEDLASNWCDQ